MVRRIRPISNDGIQSILSQINHLKGKLEKTISFSSKIDEITIERYSDKIEHLINGLMVRIYATIRTTKEIVGIIRLEEIISSLAKGETKIKVWVL